MNRAEKRAAQRLKVTKYAKTIPVPGFDGQTITVRPVAYVDVLELQKQLESDDQDLAPIIETLVTDWSFTDDDDQKLPLTAEGLREQVPLEIIVAVSAAAMEHVSGRARLPFAATSSSAPSPEPHANSA